MNFQGKAVLVYLEEDNIARAYFRVQPLMTQDGPIGPVTAEYPDDGFLRIVPDKNEQHTFKERMRSLTGLCLVDLRCFPLDANKIRTNKNYSPSRGESNQFIVYSDAVRSLPEDLLFQVVGEGEVKNAFTPQVYIRNGANIQGPFRREDGQSVGETAQLPPDSAEIHTLTVNGQENLFYWPRKVQAPPKPETQPIHSQPVPAPAPVSAPEPVFPAAPAAPAAPRLDPPAPAPAPEAPQPNAFEQIQSLNEQLGERANRLNVPSDPTPVDFLAEQPSKPLVGTRLYQTPQRQLPPRRAHNPLMEAVENQRYASRYESRYEAPGATIPMNTELKEVHNPADALKRALQGMSHSPETQRQAADVILAQSGMRITLSKALAHETNDLTLAAMQSQLQELEAERLMTLMQLDDAKKNLAAAHEEALGRLNMAEQKKVDQLHIAQQNAQNALDKLNKIIDPLEKKRQAAAEYLTAANAGLPDRQTCFICPPVGGTAAKAEMIERVEKCMKAAGFLMEEGDALTLLTAFALSAGNNEWSLYAEAEDDGVYGMRAFAAALGTKSVPFGKYDQYVVIPGGNAPVFMDCSGHPVSHPLVFFTACDRIGAPAEEGSGWMTPHCTVSLYTDPAALPQPLPQYGPVSMECIKNEMLAETPLTDETRKVIAALRSAAAETGHPMPLGTVELLARFIAVTQNEFKGGVAEAIDRACSLYVTAHILDYGLDKEAMKPQLAAMPRTLKALKL